MIEFKALRVPALTEEVALNLEAHFRHIPGIEQFTFTLTSRELRVVFDEDRIDFRSLVQAMTQAGCPLHAISAALLKQVPTERSQTMYRTILVPLDGSELAELALPHAEALARRFESDLLLLRVCPPVSTPLEFYTFAAEASEVDKDLPAQAEKDAESYISQIQEKLQGKQIQSDRIVLHGPISEMILDTAATKETDLIVMSTHGRSGLSRWVFGSVAAKVLQAAPCPVFLIRAVKD